MVESGLSWLMGCLRAFFMHKQICFLSEEVFSLSAGKFRYVNSNPPWNECNWLLKEKVNYTLIVTSCALGWKLVISLSKLLNMDIFLTQTHHLASEDLYKGDVWSTFMMDMHFYGLQNRNNHSLPL